MRIIFMGTPEFAVPSLKALQAAGHEIVAVVTAPDTMGGRGGKYLIQSEIKKYAISHGLQVLQPVKLRDKGFINQLRELSADLQVVVAFRMLPELIWNMPPMGTINVHGSLLPKYRGAAPIHWAVINGEKKTGVTVFKLRHEIDTGDIINQAVLDIGPDETTGEVYHRLMMLGAETLIKSIGLISDGKFIFKKQDGTFASPAPKIFHETAKVNFSMHASDIHNHIRGMSPKPTAWMIFEGIKYFLYRSNLTDTKSIKPTGQIWIDQNHIYLSTVDYNVMITEIQLEGKRIMTDKEFINGHKNNPIFQP